MGKTWRLEHPKQCPTCPWITGNDPFDIPNYRPEMHKNLDKTIAKDLRFGGSIRVMSCHYSKENHDNHYCIGWLVNQLGVGNNIIMRMRMMDCENSRDIELSGVQYDVFEDTLSR